MPTRIVVKVDPEITVGSAGNFSGSGRLAAICALILCSVSQSGCFWLSDQLSAVGLHETKIDVPGNLKTDLIAKPMRHTLSPPDQDMPMYIPYTYFTPSTDGIPMEPVTVHAGEMSVAGKDRAGNTRYSFPVTIAGKMLNFDGTYVESNKCYWLTRTDRSWYGYPAQIAMVATVPADLGIDVVYFARWATGMMVTW